MLRARIMRWLMGLCVIGAIAAMGITGAGSVLPEEQTAIRGVLVPADAAKTWAVLTDFPAMRRWNPGVEEVLREPDDAGRAVWRLADSNGMGMRLRVDLAEEKQLLQVRVLDATFFEGSWTFQLMPHAKGTFIKLTQESHIGNPLLRFFVNYVASVDGGMRQFLLAIARKLGAEQPEVEELVQ